MAPVKSPWSQPCARKRVFGGKDLYKKLNREWKSEGIMDGENGEWAEKGEAWGVWSRETGTRLPEKKVDWELISETRRGERS